MNYWQQRALDRQEFLNKRTQKEIDKQLAYYYEQVMKKLIKEFEAVYDKLLTTKEENLTPADLYKMDKYWQMVGQVQSELEKLGYEEIALLAAEFKNHWLLSYDNTEKEMLAFFNKRAKNNPDLEELEWPPAASFSTISRTAVDQMINEVWCADGKTWSDRVWGNVGELATMLNDELVHCVVSGKKTTELKKKLQERFAVSFSKADRLVRTEVAHIQTQASAKRYKDAGLERYEILGREETTGCNHSVDCHKMDGKTFLYSEMKVGVNAPPFHPNCRCAIAPVLDDDDFELENDVMENKKIIELNKKYGLDYSEEERKAKIMEQYSKAIKEDTQGIVDSMKKDLQKKVAKAEKKGHWGKFSLEYEKLMDFYENRPQIEKEVEEDLISKYRFCIDCGKPLLSIKGKSQNAVKRCDECKEIHRKNMKALYEKNRRQRKKANTK